MTATLPAYDIATLALLGAGWFALYVVGAAGWRLVVRRWRRGEGRRPARHDRPGRPLIDEMAGRVVELEQRLVVAIKVDSYFDHMGLNR